MTTQAGTQQVRRHYRDQSCCGGKHKTSRDDGAICRWCGVEGWLLNCTRCGFPTCDDCRKTHDSERRRAEWSRHP